MAKLTMAAEAAKDLTSTVMHFEQAPDEFHALIANINLSRKCS
jgi:hypothetical protein